MEGKKLAVHNRRDDDVDDFMANILGGSSTPQSVKPANIFKPKKKPVSLQEKQPASYTPVKATKPKRKLKKDFKKLILIFVFVILGGGLVFALSGPVSNLFAPKSPFSQEVKDNTDIKLLFPANPPGSFKIETNSINKAEANVIMYALSNDDGKRINITLQKKPDGVSLDPLYMVLKDVRDIDTKYGSIKYGTSEDGIVVANIFIENTWVIINSSTGIFDDESLTKLINGFRS